MAELAEVSDSRYLMIGNTKILDTQSIATATAVTDNSTGTPGTIITAPAGSYTQSDEANFRASVAASLNQIIAGLKNHGLFT